MEKKLTKSTNKMLCGVCGGLAEYFGMDITLMRAIYAIGSLVLAAFPGVLVYIILAVIMPDAEQVDN